MLLKLSLKKNHRANPGGFYMNQKNRISLIFLCLALNLSVAHAAIETQTPATPANFITEYRKAKNEALPMSQRWTALIKATDLATGDDFNKVMAFADSKEWYLRNASLVALDKSGNDMVYDQAKKLVTDKALVVRSAAVDILSRLNNNEIKQIFSTELEKKYNFNGKSSLWIRKQMMSHLIKNPKKSEKDFFVKYLYDQDIEVAALSTHALEKITDIRFSGKNNTEIVKQWQTVAKNQKW